MEVLVKGIYNKTSSAELLDANHPPSTKPDQARGIFGTAPSVRREWISGIPPKLASRGCVSMKVAKPIRSVSQGKALQQRVVGSRWVQGRCLRSSKGSCNKGLGFR